MLARLHTLTLDLPSELHTIEAWRWTDAMTDAALTFFSAGIAREIDAPFRALQEAAQHLDTPCCWTSGDPNPSNWGERADGTPVLYDWELVRRGVPALDLAVLVAGLGDAAKYEAVAACYLEERSRLTDAPAWRAESLPRDIALAKAWTVASLLRACVTGGGRVPDALRAQLTEDVPPWIISIARSKEARS
jgi:aminoglycoside phosphotransferase (APT) family kinase protein